MSRLFNNCGLHAVEALRYLAKNERPIGGEQSFNFADLISTANDLERELNRLERDIDQSQDQNVKNPATSQPVELLGIADQLAEKSGAWLSCSGCHDLSEGVPTGPYSEGLKCHLGLGCRECGGIGAVWDNVDYSGIGEQLGQDAPLPALSLGITKEWFEKRTTAEGDLEIGAGLSNLAVTARPKTGPSLVYRPNEFDDWGMIRHVNGRMFATVSRPLSQQEANDARRTETDPYEVLGRLLIVAVEGIVSEPKEARQSIIDLCATIAATEKNRCAAIVNDFDAAEWDRVAACNQLKTAERIRRDIEGLAESFVIVEQTTRTEDEIA
jgi:hypothetical protein